MQDEIIMGIDDATKCPCIGSIFVAGVIADSQTLAHWKKSGVKDSKLIAPKKRDELARLIKETAIDFCIDQITPQMIDDKSLNLNDWEMAIVLKIIEKLERFGTKRSGGFEKVYIDNWETSENGFRVRLARITSQPIQTLLREKKLKYSQTYRPLS